MTLQERYDNMLTLVTELRELEIKQGKLWRAGGHLPVQDKQRMSKIQFLLDRVIQSHPKAKQQEIF